MFLFCLCLYIGEGLLGLSFLLISFFKNSLILDYEIFIFNK